MKQIFTILLALILMLTFAACGGGGGQTEPANGSESLISPDSMEDFEDALEQLDALMPDGWDENRYGAYIYEVWDSEFLPDCFPDAPDGVKVDQTTFKDYDHDTLNGDYSVGPLYYDSYEDYREYGVGFYATQAQLDAFVSAVAARGMTGSQTEDGEYCFYEYYGNGWFMEIFANLMHNHTEYDYWVSVSATDCLYDLPAAISGIPLPQCGIVTYHYDHYTIQDFTDGYEDVDFDLATDSLPEKYYAAWFNYHCTVNQDAVDYARQLKELGWEVVWESDGENGYRSCFLKDGVYGAVNYYSYDGILEVGFSDMAENLSY